MKQKKALIGAVIGTTLLALGGCATAPTLTASPNQIPQQSLNNGVRVTNSSLNHSGLIPIGIATITNASTASQTIYYKFIWFDANGTAYNDQNPWTPLTLLPGMSQTVSQAATTSTSTTFNVIFSMTSN